MHFELDFELEHGVFKLELELELRSCVSAPALLCSVCLSAAATTTATTTTIESENWLVRCGTLRFLI